jgi:hypothetical protein
MKLASAVGANGIVFVGIALWVAPARRRIAPAVAVLAAVFASRLPSNVMKDIVDRLPSQRTQRRPRGRRRGVATGLLVLLGARLVHLQIGPDDDGDRRQYRDVEAPGDRHGEVKRAAE